MVSKESDGLSPTRPLQEAPRWDLPAWGWALLALTLGILLTLLAARYQQRGAEQRRADEIERAATASVTAMREQLEACELLVRSMQAVFETATDFDADTFAQVYERLQPRQRFPSLQAVVYARRVPGATGDRYVSTLVAPMVGNETVVGLDVTTQPANLSAVLNSRDTDTLALSAPFRLAQVPPSERADGVTLRVPIYTPGPRPRSLAERRERFRGSAAVSFRVGRLIDDSLKSNVRHALHVRIDDVTSGEPMPLFDSHSKRQPVQARDIVRELEFGGRRWHLRMHSAGAAQVAAPWWQTVGLPGLLASLLFAAVVYLSLTTRRKARAMALQLSERYRESEERFRALNELLPALVLLARSRDGHVTYGNQAARLRLGDFSAGQLLPDLFEDDELRAQLREGSTTGCSNAEALLRTQAGGHFWATVSIVSVIVGGEAHLLMVAADISEQRELTELLGYQASHDALTDLYNRREFERRVEHALAGIASGAPPSALLYIDLDQFKLINDTSGHLAGDQLLIQLGEMMREQLRGGDVLARLGGDEFGVLATSVQDEGGARLVAERLRQRIDGHVFVWEERSYAISASIGGVMLHEATATLSDLLASADTACYQAKEAGRNRVQFFSALDIDTTRRRSEMKWATRLRWAVDEGRLELHYQEVWPLAQTDAGPSIELLVRFRDEAGTLILPGAFLPAAERYGLMPMIDRWVVETAFAHFDTLHPDGAALKLATINLSGATLDDDGIVGHIIDSMRRHAVDPSRVCFEVTETVAIRNVAQVSRFIGRLRDIGCRIALDDFGAGMSSFGYLKNLPVDIIKIDGSFVRDLTTDPMSMAIVRAVTEIGHQRGMLVVAEWVSSDEIMHALVEIGVDYAQGFGLHMPEPVAYRRA